MQRTYRSVKDPPPMRVAVLMTGLTAYQAVCFRAFADRGHQLLIVHPPSLSFAQFEYEDSSHAIQRVEWSDNDTMPTADELVPLVAKFDPDVVIMWSWHGDGYRTVVKRWKGRALRIIFSSNFWRGTGKQVAGIAVSRQYVTPLFDAVWVPSERAEHFARRLGFSGDQVIRGANCADTKLFNSGPRKGDEIASRRRFLFTGRLIWHKAPRELAQAYVAYRERVADPWDLVVAGDGPMKVELQGIKGIEWRGFVSPESLAALMAESSCLILPSHVEWYGVVVHEAAVAGLPIICSDGVGATPYLLQDGYNGWTVPAGSVEELTEAMIRMSEVGSERLQEMSDASRALGGRLTPRIWARHLESELSRRRARLSSTSRRTRAAKR